MNGKQLKNSILQWAIQGKLVPQDPNDEPASVLLEKIRAEKARLVKEGKIKKDKKESIIYRGEDNSYYEKFADGKVVCIDDEIPFEIPESWCFVRLGDICNYLHRGKTPKYGNQKILPIIAQKCNHWDQLYIDRCLFSDTDYIFKYKEEQFLQKGDIIINSTGGGTVGRTGYIDATVFEKFDKFVADSHVTVVRSTKLVSHRYIYHYLLSPYIQIGIEERCTGSTNQIELRTTTISDYLVPIPPVEEQKRIVEKVESMLPVVTRYEKLQRNLDYLNSTLPSLIKKSILQEAIQGKLIPQEPNDEPASVLLQRIKEEKQRLVKEGKLKKKDIVDSIIYKGDDNKYYEQIGKNLIDITDEIPFEIPNNWVWTRLSNVANIYTGNSISETEKKAKYTNVVGRYYIGTKDVGFDNKIFYNNGIAIPRKYEQEFRIAPKHSILMCIEGGSAGRKIAILNQDVCFGNKLCCFSPFAGIERYIYYYLQSPSFIDMFNGNKTGIIGGVSIAKVKRILIPLPPQPELERIVAKIDEFVASIMNR